MALASWIFFHHYGPAAGASYFETEPSSVVAGLKGTGRMAGSVAASSSVPFARAIRLKHSPAAILASSSMVGGPMRGAARMAVQIDVGATPSAGDNAGELLASIVDNGLSVRESLRLILAAAAGDIVNTGGTGREVRGAGGVQARITATVDGSSRDVTVLDVST